MALFWTSVNIVVVILWSWTLITDDIPERNWLWVTIGVSFICLCSWAAKNGITDWVLNNKARAENNDHS